MTRLVATLMVAVPMAVAATPAAAATGHPIGGCATRGGWELVHYAVTDPDNGSAIAVDITYGNADGYLCAKLPSEHAAFYILVDNTTHSGG